MSLYIPVEKAQRGDTCQREYGDRHNRTYEEHGFGWIAIQSFPQRQGYRHRRGWHGEEYGNDDEQFDHESHDITKPQDRRQTVVPVLLPASWGAGGQAATL